MKILIKLFTLIILTLFICLTVIPTALADDAESIDIESVSADGTGYTYSDNKVTIDTDGIYHITGTTTTNSIRVNSGVTADITFDNVSIDVGGTNTNAFSMAGATVNLTLVGNNSLISGGYSAGLEAPTGSVLTIFGDSTATLTAQGGSRGAGIGGGADCAGGMITINGGDVTARGGDYGAGIGGGFYGDGGTITINGGNITASGGDMGAGIGGGCLGSGGTITINGGNITASGGDFGAGIGGGYEASGGTIDIQGGDITARGGDNGAGIGGGGSYFDVGGAGGMVTISGGTVIAQGGNNGAGIGGGGSDYDVGGAGGTVVADGENTTVSATGGGNGYDVGSGSGNSSGGSLTVQNDATVMMNRNGTNANASFTTGTVGGDGAGLLAGTYLNSQKLLTFSGVTASPTSGAKAFDDVTLTANVTGLSTTDPQGQIAFFAGGTIIGQASLTRAADGSADATADFIWSSRGGSHTITAQYVQDDSDSYYMTNDGELADYDVAKIEQAPLSISGIPGTVTYGDEPFMLSISGGSGTGGLTYSVTEGDAVSVSTSGEVTVEKAGQATITVAKAGDANYLPVSATVSITVNKAEPEVTFPDSGEITYEQSLSDSALTGGSGDGSFAWEDPDTIPTVDNSGYRVVFTPDDTDNYNTVTQTVLISVLKAEQASLVIDGIPDTITYGDLPFELLVSGGSGTGDLSYEVTSGDAASVDMNGIVTIEQAGDATVLVTKAADSNYHEADTTVNITVNKAIPDPVFPSASLITYGQPLSDSVLTGGSGDGSFEWENPDTVPTVINDGFDVVFTPFDTHNYLPIKQTVTLTVAKAVQAPLNVSGIPATLTFGDAPFALSVSGGSGTGTLSYAVVTGNAVTADASGKVTITHGGAADIKVTNLGDDNYLPVSRTVSLTVNKAEQTAALSFALPESITYGDTPFQIIGSGGNGSGAFSYQVASGNAVAVSTTGAVTVIRLGEAVITAVKAGDSDYLSQEKTMQISVGKGAQRALVITGIPSRITSDSAPFGLVVNGGSGSGIVSYAVTSGSAVSVDTDGKVTILRSGTAVLTITKATDDYYLATTATVELNVRKATSSEDNVEAPSASPTPSAAPSPTVAPSPTDTDASPSPTESPVSLKPASIQADETTGIIIATINFDDLPKGTAFIQLPSGEVIQVDPTQSTLELPISQDDLNEDGEFVLIALDAENVPLGNYLIDLSDDTWQVGTAGSGSGFVSVLVWIAVGVLVIGVSLGITVIWYKKKK